MGAVVQPTARNTDKNTDRQPRNEVPGKKAISQEENEENEQIKALAVVAIDFGTVHSGFAYSFQGYEENIKSAEHGGIFQQDRVPTILLLYPDKTFHSFGYKAETSFFELSDNDKSKFYYFENFKMKIYNKYKVKRQMVISDVSGKQLEAMTVFSIAIKHLKDEASKIIYSSKLGLKDTDIQWMITIPAISSDSARQFMREASVKAGILETHLRLVLEPEAAALYSKPRIMSEEVPLGFQYVLADLGGGTSDICVHKILDGGKLQEVYRATGEVSGGSDVDKRFINMMQSITRQIWSEFSSSYSTAYIRLINEFRLKKKEFKSSTTAIRLKMENALVHILNEKLNRKLEDLIKESKYAGKLEYNSIEAILTITKEILVKLFEPSVNIINNKLSEVINNCTDHEIKTIILVGGYSESPYLRERIQSKFSNMRVVLVDDARLAVLNGAVMMGWKPKNIIQRRSKYTYGFSSFRPFLDGIDPDHLKVNCNGEYRCYDVFLKMIEKGQTVEFGQTFKHEGNNRADNLERKHKKAVISLYRSTLEDPQYCTEHHGCKVVGRIEATPPLEGWPDHWTSVCHLIVGETEFTVKYFNVTTGDEYEAQMDFL